MFVGRNRELSKLNQIYQSDSFEFVVFYGRRRVGKTTLINEFLMDKKSIYYMGVEGSQYDNLKGMSIAYQSVESRESTVESPVYESYESLLQAIDTLARSGERIVLAIDEYPYLAAAYPAISSMLQSHIDQCWKDSNLFLILCGSSMSFMEEQVLGYQSPLYGRRTAQFKIKPFTFYECQSMYPHFEPEEQAILYGVTGGIPEYLSRVNEGKTLDDNIKELFFEESGRLFEETSNLLKQELKEPATYHSIISAIASGASRMNEIATKTGLESSGCSNQITTLIALGIVRKEYPITDKPTSRKTIYRLQDSMFLFWYRFVRPNLSNIVRGIGEIIYVNQVKPQMSDFMGSIFEEMCLQYIYSPEIYQTLPFPIGNSGRWWGTNQTLKCQEEIDIVAISENKILLGECKWKNELQGVDVIETLLRRGRLLEYSEQYYYLFGKVGFTKEAEEYAKKHGRITLVTYKDMLEILT